MENAKILYTLKGDIASMAKSFMTKNSLNYEEFSKKVGYSTTAIKLYIANKYNSNPAKLEAALLSFLQSQGEINNEVTADKIEFSRKRDFYTTSDSANVLSVCQSCQEYKGLGLIIGKSGYGKSRTLKEYKKLERVCYIECNDGMNRRDLLKTIERELGLPKGSGSLQDRIEAIRDFFTINEGYLLIIDEADKLISKDTQSKLETIRAIFDSENVGVLVAGEPKLEALIKQYLPRFANRVDFYLKLKGLASREVEGYLVGLKLTAEALNEMIVRATNSHTGCFRLMARTLKNVLRLVNEDDEITLDVIRKASSMMML